MGRYSIQAGIGIRRVFGDACPSSDHPHSNSPFKTQIGVGKVIKGWDEGELLSIGSSAHIATVSSYPYVPRIQPFHSCRSAKRLY